MKRMITVILMILLLFILIFRTYMTGSRSFNNEILIQIPKYSILKYQVKNHLSMKNFRSYYNLKQEKKKNLIKYNPISYNQKKYFYDTTNDIVIKKYEIKNYILWNSIDIYYEIGNYCE